MEYLQEIIKNEIIALSGFQDFSAPLRAIAFLKKDPKWVL